MIRSRHRWLCLGTTALACAAAPAAELVVRDVRVGFEYLPTAFDFTLTAPQGEFSGSDLLTSSLFPGLEIPLSRLFRLTAG